ncbi:MAG: hypothetical protein ACXVEF_04985 [Polyangiales bacterium]
MRPLVWPALAVVSGLAVPFISRAGTPAPGTGVDASCKASIPEVDGKKPALGATSVPSQLTLPIQAFHPIVGSAAPRGSASGTPIELRIELPKTKKAGEVLSPKLVVLNTSKATLSILKPMDGSYDHARFPYWDVYARDEKTQQVYRWTYGAMRCGNTNAPHEADHVVIDPGKSVTPKLSEWGSAVEKAILSTPGTYTVWVEYAFCGYGISALSLGKPELRSDAVVGRFASNGVKITVQ